MNKTAVLVLALSSVMIMSGSLAFAQGDISGTSTSSSAMIKLSTYTVGSYNSFGTMTNISYTSSETGNQTQIASAIYVNGSAISIPSNTGSEKVSFMSLSNETLIGINGPNAFLIATAPNAAMKLNSLNTSMNFDLSVQAKKIGAGLNLSSESSLGNLISFNTYLKLSMKGYTVYSISNESFKGYFVTNGNAKLSSNGLSINVTNNGNMVLLAGFISNGNLQNMLYKYFGENERENRFTYNSSTSVVMGKFVNFNYSLSHQSIINLTGRFSGRTVPVFTSINASGNGSFGSDARMTNIPMNKVVIIGSVFFYANNSFIYVLHDNPAMESTFAIDNGTMNFTLASGLNATVFSSTSAMVSYNAPSFSNNMDAQGNMLLGIGGHVNAGSKTIRISGNNFSAFMTVAGNTSVSVNGGVISLKTTGVSVVHFVSPPGLRDLGEFEKSVNNAIMSGKISTQIYLNATGSGINSNLTVGFNGSVNADISSMSQGKATINISSTNHKGTLIAVFVTKQFMGSSSNVYLKFDGNVINITSANAIFNVTSTTNAYYAVINESSGILILIHVPHFSNHTIQVSSTPFTSTTSGTPSAPVDTQYIAIGALVAIAAIVGVTAVILRKKK